MNWKGKTGGGLGRRKGRRAGEWHSEPPSLEFSPPPTYTHCRPPLPPPRRFLPRFMLAVILANCVTLALATPAPGFDASALGRRLALLDFVWLALFTAEVVVRVVALGLVRGRNSYLRDREWSGSGGGRELHALSLRSEVVARYKGGGGMGVVETGARQRMWMVVSRCAGARVNHGLGGLVQEGADTTSALGLRLLTCLISHPHP